MKVLFIRNDICFLCKKVTRVLLWKVQLQCVLLEQNHAPDKYDVICAAFFEYGTQRFCTFFPQMTIVRTTRYFCIIKEATILALVF